MDGRNGSAIPRSPALLPEGFAQNDSGYFRVRYLEAGEMHQTDVSPDQLLPLERARVRVKSNQADIRMRLRDWR
ncbi:hypothetical protein H6F89_21045 [Cyanobacteria bacterium FACHB-63]|nr:hypothetical protein [Cyanobacteria bacterium FACHB-63]